MKVFTKLELLRTISTMFGLGELKICTSSQRLYARKLPSKNNIVAQKIWRGEKFEWAYQPRTTACGMRLNFRSHFGWDWIFNPKTHYGYAVGSRSPQRLQNMWRKSQSWSKANYPVPNAEFTRYSTNFWYRTTASSHKYACILNHIAPFLIKSARLLYQFLQT